LIGLKKRKLSQKKISDKGIDIWRGRVVSLSLSNALKVRLKAPNAYLLGIFLALLIRNLYRLRKIKIKIPQKFSFSPPLFIVNVIVDDSYLFY